MEKLRNAWAWFSAQDTPTKIMLGVVTAVAVLAVVASFG